MESKKAGKVNPEHRRSRHSKKFKREAVRLLERRQKPATQLALELGIRRNLFYKWQKQLDAQGDQALRGAGRATRWRVRVGVAHYDAFVTGRALDRCDGHRDR